MSTRKRQLRVLLASLAIALAWAVPAQAQWQAKTADRYPARQKQGDLIVAVKPFVSEKDQKSVFGKIRPFEHGVTPLLVVMSNIGTNSYSLENLQVRFITADREGLEPVRGEDLATFNPKGHQPSRRSVPGVPGLGRSRVKKGPLARPEIMRNEFRAPIVTPKSTASGFFYFWVGDGASLAAATAYISGVYDMTNGKDLFYFEIPIQKYR